MADQQRIKLELTLQSSLQFSLLLDRALVRQRLEKGRCATREGRLLFFVPLSTLVRPAVGPGSLNWVPKCMFLLRSSNPFDGWFCLPPPQHGPYFWRFRGWIPLTLEKLALLRV